MILQNFGSWWSGAKLSYLRYLTFKSLRHFHPHSRIQLFTSNKFDNKKSSDIKDLECYTDIGGKDYMGDLKKLNVEIVQVNSLGKFSSFQQADIYRWAFLKHHGGIYLDPDQIILQSFSTLPLNKYKFMYSSYKVDSPMVAGWNHEFSPIGVLGAEKNCKIVNHIVSKIFDYQQEGNYNALGVIMMNDMIKKIDMSEGFNAPSHYFYPAPIGDRMGEIFNGNMKFGKENWACHFYGGYSPSQDFNRKYTEEFAKNSQDSISSFLRERKII